MTTQPGPYRHPVNKAIYTGQTRGDKIVTRFVAFFGSVPFIAWQTAVIITWIIFNSLTLTGNLHYDRYPFILLNLLFSTQAAYAAPLILLAQNRQADRDRRQAEHDYAVNETALTEIRATRDLTREVRSVAAEIHQLTVSQMTDLAGIGAAGAKLDLLLRAVLPPPPRPRGKKEDAP